MSVAKGFDDIVDNSSTGQPHYVVLTDIEQLVGVVAKNQVGANEANLWGTNRLSNPAGSSIRGFLYNC
ncbi:hypothetical protein CRG98_013703 [Punica granatum]|nr:hypothetical protein CRG98_013703 [Punica granatum]